MILKRTDAFILTLFVAFEVVSASWPRQNYEENEGTLTSHDGSPSSYGHNMSCTYYIKPPSWKRITILGCMLKCSEDSLEIFFGCGVHNGNLSVGFCPNLSLPKILTHGHCMMLVFKAGPSTKCSTSLLHSSNGTVFTPNWPLKYPPDASCLWSLSLRSKAVRFFFSAFDLEINFICKTDAGQLSTDDISISGITTAGREAFIKERVCEMPDVPHFHVKDMASVSIKFRANNNKKEGTGAVFGYLSYKDGTLNSDLPGCKDIRTFSTNPTTRAFSTKPTRTSSTSPTVPGVSPTGSTIRPNPWTIALLSLITIVFCMGVIPYG